MDHSSVFGSIFIIFIILSLLVRSSLSVDNQFEACVPKKCGDNLSISFPFWISGEHESYCGHPFFRINCTNNEPILSISNDQYIVRNIFHTNQSVLVSGANELEDDCPIPRRNLAQFSAPFTLSSNNMNLCFFYNCTSNPVYLTHQIPCAINKTTRHHSFFVYVHDEEELGTMTAYKETCDSVVKSAVDDEGMSYRAFVEADYLETLRRGFLLEWGPSNCTGCEASGGHCGFKNGEFICFCRDKPYSKVCNNDTAVSVDLQFEACKPWDCGKGPKISYPFWVAGEQQSYCGYPNSSFQLSCIDDEPIINLSGVDYIIREILYSEKSLSVYKRESSNNICSSGIKNITLNSSPFVYGPAHVDVFVFFACKTPFPTEYLQYLVRCTDSDPAHHSLALFSNDTRLNDVVTSRICETSVIIPVDIIGNSSWSTVPSNELIVEGLKDGFNLRWDKVSDCNVCQGSGGRCGFDFVEYKVMCFCPDRPHHKQCQHSRSKKMKKVIIGVGAGAGVLLLACVFFLIRLRRKKHQSKSSALISRSLTPDSSIKPDLERGTSSYFQTPIFSYSELQEATDNFDSSKEIGDGGFGTVYHGTLRDGRVVAVKRLYENNYKRHDQFMNELEILSRLRHRNLVTLYGCTTRHSRELLLVYEYIPNGTVADNLHGDRASTSPLTWPVRLSVAIETADALSYLHASDIIHRDVKTNNILLDHNFHVKVADFGLSRLFPMNATHVSTAPQGTPGYVDPEYYQCYQLNDKSDVYSFGVVLIELISSKPAVDIGRHRHEINLSNMAINKIHNDALHELVDPSLGFESDYSVRRMITMVAELAFRCLQQEKDMRPCMMEVLKCLKDIESAEKVEKAEEIDIPADARLLKNVPPFSPTSVTDKWVSSTTTPNTSG